MTGDEARSLYRSIFAAFPSYAEYVERQADPVATLKAWCRLIASCEYVDALVVVDSILDGKVDVRGKYDRADHLPLVIRGRAQRIKEDRDRFNKTAELADKSVEVKRTRGRFTYDLNDLYTQVRANTRRLNDGEITVEQHAELLAELRRKARVETPRSV